MGASSQRLQYQNQFIATDADEITTQTANTDEILLAETTWDEVINGITPEGAVTNSSFTPAAGSGISAQTSTSKGEIVQYDGSDWVSRGNLTEFSGISDVSGTIAIASAAGAFVATPPAGNILIADQAISGVAAGRLATGTSAADGEVFLADGTDWTSQGLLTTLSKISTLADIDVGTALKASPAENDIVIFSAAATGLTGFAAPEGNFHPVQPLIIESSLRGGGENIPLPYKTGNSAMTKDAPGPISVEEGMVFAGTGDGMEMLYRMMTQTRLPTATRLNTANPTGDVATALTLSSGSTLTTGTGTLTDISGNLISLSTFNDGISDTTSNPRKVPVRLDATPSGAPGTGNIGLVEIKGRDKDNLPIQEFLVWSGADAAAKKTKNYYIKLDSYASSGWESSQTLAIAYTDTSHRVVYEPQDAELVAFWFVRLVRGITPTLFSGVIGNSFELALGRDTALEWNVTCLGKRSWPNRNLRGIEATDPGSGPGTGGRVPLADSIGFADPNIFTGWQCELDIGGTRMALIDSTLSINQNLENSGVITGDRYEESQPFRGTDRDVMVDGTVVYSPENNLSQVFLDNVTLEDVQLNLRNRPRGGFYWLTRFVFPTTQINTNPDPASPRDGRISQTFNLKCFTEGVGGGPKDYRIETYVPDYSQVRDFS